jgi:hypothetical protein
MTVIEHVLFRPILPIRQCWAVPSRLLYHVANRTHLQLLRMRFFQYLRKLAPRAFCPEFWWPVQDCNPNYLLL